MPVLLLLVSEEEIGSPVSRAVTERLAKRCAAALVMEPAQGLHGAYKTARKGIANYELRVRGVAAHSGVDFEKGHSAVLELMRLLAKGGKIYGPEARADGESGSDWRRYAVERHRGGGVGRCGCARCARSSDAVKVEKMFRSLRCTDKMCSLTVTGGMNRPPMERKAGTIALFKRAQKIAAADGSEAGRSGDGWWI